MRTRKSNEVQTILEYLVVDDANERINTTERLIKHLVNKIAFILKNNYQVISLKLPNTSRLLIAGDELALLFA